MTSLSLLAIFPLNFISGIHVVIDYANKIKVLKPQVCLASDGFWGTDIGNNRICHCSSKTFDNLIHGWDYWGAIFLLFVFGLFVLKSKNHQFLFRGKVHK